MRVLATAIRGHDSTECRALHTADTLESEDSGGQHRAAVPGRDCSRRATFAHELVRHGDAVTWLGTDCFRRMLIHRDDLVSVHDLQVEAARIVAPKFLLYRPLGSDQQHADAKLACRLHCAQDDLTRRVVSTHHIQRDSCLSRCVCHALFLPAR